MPNELKTYLEWRFRVNNVPKYQRYRDEWLANLTEVQIHYLYIEMNRMINKGFYTI